MAHEGAAAFRSFPPRAVSTNLGRPASGRGPPHRVPAKGDVGPGANGTPGQAGRALTGAGVQPVHPTLARLRT